MTAKVPDPPKTLSARSRKLWRAVTREYELSAAENELLHQACESLDRADEAAAVVRKEGVTVRDRYGSPKQHPAADVEARHRSLFASLIRQLGVQDDDEETPASRRGRQAANARWQRRHSSEEARGAQT